MTRLWIMIGIAAVAVAFAGCGDEDGHDHEHGHGDDGAHLICTGDETPYTEGLIQAGDSGNLKVRVDKVEPAGATVGENTFHITVLDGADAPITDATLDKAETWQHVHDHGVGVEAEITSEGDGKFTISKMTPIHKGSWEFRFTVTGGGATEMITVLLCVPEA